MKFDEFVEKLHESRNSPLENADIQAIEHNLEVELRKHNYKFKNVVGELRYVFGGSELVFRVNNCSFKYNGKYRPIKNFSFIISEKGTVSVNASSSKTKHLVPYPVVAHFDHEKMAKSQGSVNSLIQFVKEAMENQFDIEQMDN
jgi:hypothetical protein